MKCTLVWREQLKPLSVIPSKEERKLRDGGVSAAVEGKRKHSPGVCCTLVPCGVGGGGPQVEVLRSKEKEGRGNTQIS